MRLRKHAMGCRSFLKVAFLLWILPTMAQGNEPLQWKFRKDERIAIDVDQNSVVQESSRTETKIRQRTSLEWRVIDVDSEGTATIEHRTQRVRLSVSDPKEEINADSDTDADSVSYPKISGIWAIARAPMKEVFRFRLSSLGDIVDFETSKTTDTLYTPKVAIAFPKAGPKIGEPWTVQSRMVNERSKLLLTTSYQLVGKETVDGRELSKIKTSTAFQLDQGSEAKLVSQNALGLIWFDPIQGKVARSESHQEIGIEVEQEGSTTLQSIQQSTEISYRFESGPR
jgi:hypothetical protein